MPMVVLLFWIIICMLCSAVGYQINQRNGFSHVHNKIYSNIESTQIPVITLVRSKLNCVTTCQRHNGCRSCSVVHYAETISHGHQYTCKVYSGLSFDQDLVESIGTDFYQGKVQQLRVMSKYTIPAHVIFKDC